MMHELQQSILKHSLRLGAFAAVAALLLGFVHVNTKERIAEQVVAAERRALYQVLPPALHNNDLLNDSVSLDPASSHFIDMDLLGIEDQRVAYLARIDGVISGVILPVVAHDGYSGDIILLVGINVDGSLSGVRIINHKETPGLGDKIDLRVSEWILGFNSRSLSNPPLAQWRVKKDDGEFDQFVGATVTPRAVVSAVKNALLFFQLNRQLLTVTGQAL